MFYRKDVDHAEAEGVLATRKLGQEILRWLLLVVFVLCAWKVWHGPTPNNKDVRARLEEGERLTFKSWLDSGKENPPRLRAKEHAPIGWWWAAVGGAGVSFVLFLTLPYWGPDGRREGDPVHDAPQADEENIGDSGFGKLISGRPVFLLFVGLAVVIGGWLRAPRLDHSLWNDEEYAARKHIVGDYKVDASGGRVFRPVPWLETLAENGSGNNHVLHSVLSRFSIRIWQTLTDKGPEVLSERWLRMPSFLAGLAAIWLIGLVGWEFGNRWVGVTAAWILALHPWHIRYAVEARGYSLMLFFLLLAVLGLIRAQRGHSLRAWLLFAVGEAGMLASFAGSIYVAVALNVVALIEMALRGQPRRIGALLAMNALAAVAVMFLMLPSVPQMTGFMLHDAQKRLPVTGEWLRDLGSHVLTGVQYANLMTTDHSGTSWLDMAGKAPMVMGPLAWFLGLFVVLGVISAFFESAPSRFAVLSLVCAGGLGFLHAHLSKHPNLSWYYLYLMVPLCLGVGLAVVRLQVAPAVLCWVMVGCFGFATDVPREVMRRVDRQPIRQTVEAVRDFRQNALTGVFGVSDKQAESYDPDVMVIEKPEDVDKLIQMGADQRREVFVYFAGMKESAVRNPSVHQRVTASPDFARWKDFKGTEAMFSYVIYRCVPLAR